MVLSVRDPMVSTSILSKNFGGCFDMILGYSLISSMEMNVSHNA
jgi:hypothetical protein